MVDFLADSEVRVEITLMNKRQINMFQIPPITSAKGHKAEDWKGGQMWTG